MSCHQRQSALFLLQAMTRTRRPRLLLQTARAGVAEYRRETDLRRVLRLPAAPAPGPGTVQALVALEADLEVRRKRRFQMAGEPWRPARHVEVMIALIAEARLMAEAVPQPAAPRVLRPGPTEDGASLLSVVPVAVSPAGVAARQAPPMLPG